MRPFFFSSLHRGLSRVPCTASFCVVAPSFLFSLIAAASLPPHGAVRAGPSVHASLCSNRRKKSQEHQSSWSLGLSLVLRGRGKEKGSP